MKEIGDKYDKLTDTEMRILSYIKQCVKGGKQYFKSKYIGKDIGLSSKEVGSRLLSMSEKRLDSIKIIRYARSLSTTWKAERINDTKLPRKESG